MLGLIGSVMGLPQSSTMAPAVDALYDFIFWTSLVGLILVSIALLYFVILHHRRKRGEQTPYIEGNDRMELSVVVVLTVWVMFIFYWGWIDYKKLVTTPTDSLEINVYGKQWSWEFEYLNGRRSINKLVVPKGEKVTLLMTSKDVLHSFYVPNFRIKQDIIPKAYSMVWFEATELGEHHLFCAEYCGTAHSGMIGKVVVVEPDVYKKWQQKWEFEQQLGVSIGDDQPLVSLAQKGAAAFSAKGCVACHSTSGVRSVGPKLNGIFGKEVVFKDGQKNKVDESYLRESIMDPNTKLVAGFGPVMPTYRGTLTDEETNALVAYIKSLKE